MLELLERTSILALLIRELEALTAVKGRELAMKMSIRVHFRYK